MNVDYRALNSRAPAPPMIATWGSASTHHKAVDNDATFEKSLEFVIEKLHQSCVANLFYFARERFVVLRSQPVKGYLHRAAFVTRQKNGGFARAFGAQGEANN